MISSVLPGARSIRAPFFAGLLWTLFFWFLWAEEIPSEGDVPKMANQAVELIRSIGQITTLVLASILIFALGATATFATRAVSSAIGRLIERFRSKLTWQRHAHKSRRALRARLSEYQRTIKLAAAATEKEDDRITVLQGHVSSAERHRDQVQEKLDLLEQPLLGWAWVQKFWIPNDQVTRAALGHISVQDELTVANRIVDTTYDAAAWEYADKLGLHGASYGGSVAPDAAYELIDEFRPDPVDALKALDNDLFVEIDRERSERELRVAISAPLIALSVYAAVEVSMWFSVAVLITTALLIAHSVSPATERTRIMKLVNLKGKETPTIRDTVISARVDVGKAKALADRNAVSE